jgi:hypothetical protein
VGCGAHQKCLGGVVDRRWIGGFDDVSNHTCDVVRGASLEGKPDEGIDGCREVGVRNQGVAHRLVAHDAGQAVAAHQDPIAAPNLDQLEVQLGITVTLQGTQDH